MTKAASKERRGAENEGDEENEGRQRCLPARRAALTGAANSKGGICTPDLMVARRDLSQRHPPAGAQTLGLAVLGLKLCFPRAIIHDLW